MNNSRFFLLALLFAIATPIYGQKTSKPTVVRTDIKGRLLTPEEGCGYSKTANNRIVGGSAAKNGAWPWLALLGSKFKGINLFRCGGSLITSRHILTAGHCVPIVTFARLGEYDTSSYTDGKHLDINITQKYAHEKWNMTFAINDIAVLKLMEDITFNDRIRPICLPLSVEFLTHSFVGENPFIAGWGRTGETNRISSVLQQVQLPVISNAECKEMYNKLGRVKADVQFSGIVLCAGFTAGGKDSCQGDSGGPMMLPVQKDGKFPYYQIGVVSWGLGCARPNVPGVYTNVRRYMHWIKGKLIL